MVDHASLGLRDPGGVKLPPEPSDRIEALGAALATRSGDEKASVARVVAANPDFVAGWAALGDIAFRDGHLVEAYAYYRVGYHRSLDRLRGNGWKGGGPVPYDHEPNRAFFHAVDGLMRVSAAIGDDPEADRCAALLLESDAGDPLHVADLSPGTRGSPPAR